MGKENLGAEWAPGGKERESGIELLRILAVAGVVILHYNSVGGALGYASLNDLNYRILCALESAFICAVNTFMIISGYFMYGKLRVSLRKPVSLLVQLIAFEGTLYLLKVLASQGEFAWKSLALCLGMLLMYYAVAALSHSVYDKIYVLFFVDVQRGTAAGVLRKQVWTTTGRAPMSE